jgi:phage repressor protein C with HTH and peptisase S24 domain
MAETMGDRIRKLRERRGIEAADLARRVKLAYSTLKDLENNHQKSTTKLPGLIRELQTNARYLETGKGDPDAMDTEEPDWANVLATVQGVALGDGAAPEDYSESHKLKFRASSLARKGLKPDKLQVFYGRGDSMEPRIHSGDAILVNTAETKPVHDAIFMVRWEGQLFAKRLKRFGKQWFLASDNTADPKWREPKAIEDDHDFEILGRVRWIGSWEG